MVPTSRQYASWPGGSPGIGLVWKSYANIALRPTSDGRTSRPKSWLLWGSAASPYTSRSSVRVEKT